MAKADGTDKYPPSATTVKRLLNSAAELNRAILRTQTVLNLELGEINRKARFELARLLRLPEDHVAIGSWSCPESPITVCVYNSFVDPCHDDCIFCHDPEERK